VPYTIRPGLSDDTAALPGIEREAGTRFRPHQQELGISDEMLEQVTPASQVEEALRVGGLWVAEDPNGAIVGFAVAREWGEVAHLDELNVIPAHGRRGIGKQLVLAVCAWAREKGCKKMTLATFRGIPWNAPFYQKLGFRPVEAVELSDRHLLVVESERSRGLRMDRRVIMEYLIA
jgi:GNAT superfamily N-acetyltransferase